MKQLTLLLTLICLSLYAFAEKNLATDITMESYEQSWLDVNGALALKNNTNEPIKNISFIITYLDMSDKPMDYETFVMPAEIAPGKTKKFELPAYEYNRSYNYYKSEGRSSGGKSFKIKFELQDYNFDSEVLDEEVVYDTTHPFYNYFNEDKDSKEESTTMIILGIVMILFVLATTIGLYVLVAVMAHRRRRSVILWVALSLIGTPLLIIIILLVVGDNNDDRPNYIE